MAYVLFFFFQAEDGIRDVRTWLEFRRVLFRSWSCHLPSSPSLLCNRSRAIRLLTVLLRWNADSIPALLVNYTITIIVVHSNGCQSTLCIRSNRSWLAQVILIAVGVVPHLGLIYHDAMLAFGSTRPVWHPRLVRADIYLISQSEGRKHIHIHTGLACVWKQR